MIWINPGISEKKTFFSSLGVFFPVPKVKKKRVLNDCRYRNNFSLEIRGILGQEF